MITYTITVDEKVDTLLVNRFGVPVVEYLKELLFNNAKTQENDEYVKTLSVSLVNKAEISSARIIK